MDNVVGQLTQLCLDEYKPNSKGKIFPKYLIWYMVPLQGVTLMIWFLLMNSMLSVISFLSLKRMRKRISVAEIFVILMVSIIVAEQAQIIIALNLKKIEEDMSMIPYWTTRLYEMGILPVLISWNNYFWLTMNKRWTLKIGVTICLTVFHVFVIWLFVLLGIFTFKQWNLGYTTVLILTVILISLLLQAYFRSQFKKGESL
jgi:hypothetical protein